MSQTITNSVFIGDLHLRPQTWTNRPEIKGDAYDSLTQIIEFCAQHKASLVLMGDTFNANRPDSMSIDVFRTAMTTMKVLGLPVYAIQGQHDRSNPPWPMAVCGDEIIYVNKQRFQPITNGPVFYGLDQHPVDVELQAALKEVPADVTMLVMHQLARDVFPLDGAWDFDSAWVPEGINTLYIGDYHVSTDFDWRGGKAYYSGSAYMCSISEAANKSFLHLTTAGNAVHTRRIPLKTRRCHKLAVSDEATLQAVVDKLGKPFAADENDGGQMPIVVVDYIVSVPEVMKRIEPLLKDRAILWPIPTSNRVEWRRDGLAADTEIHHATMESCVGTFLAPDTEAHALTLDLLSSMNVEDTLNVWRTKKNLVTQTAG